MSNYYVGRPDILNSPLFIKRIREILDSKQFTNNGPFVRELEYQVEQYLGVTNCIAVTNASVALELAVQALLWGRDSDRDEIILPSFTFCATAHAVVRSGFKPVFVEIDNNYCISVKDIERKITKKTAAIIPVNVFGNTCDFNYLDIFKGWGIKLIYDSAHALGCCDMESEKYVGNFGDCEVFSLHATKLITSGEGGLITTNNLKLADKIRKSRNFGFSPGASIHGEVVDIGTNAKMDEFRGALGLTSFENIQEIIEHNYVNYSQYKKLIPKPLIMRDKNCYFSNYSYVVVEAPAGKREQILKYLHNHGIHARKYFQPIHTMEPYKHLKVSLPVTESIAERLITLPTGTAVNTEDIIYITSVLGDSLC